MAFIAATRAHARSCCCKFKSAYSPFILFSRTPSGSERGITQDYYTGFDRSRHWLYARSEFTGVALIFIFDERLCNRHGAAALRHRCNTTRLTHCPPVISPLLRWCSLPRSIRVSKWNIYKYMYVLCICVLVCSKVNRSCGMSSIQFRLWAAHWLLHSRSLHRFQLIASFVQMNLNG